MILVSLSNPYPPVSGAGDLKAQWAGAASCGGAGFSPCPEQGQPVPWGALVLLKAFWFAVHVELKR